MADWTEELERLGELREKGLLSDEEFETEKSQLLSSKESAPVQQVETISLENLCQENRFSEL